MKNSVDQGGCYPQRPKAEVDNTLQDLPNFYFFNFFFYLFYFPLTTHKDKTKNK